MSRQSTGFSGRRTTPGTCDQVTLPSKRNFAYVIKLRGDCLGGPNMPPRSFSEGGRRVRVRDVG